MASSNQTPDVLFSPIAANADASDINTIPQTYDPANYGYAAQNVGFPTECRLPVKNPDGTLGQGRAPRMQDWNGIMKLISSHNFFLQNGGSYTFNPTVSSNIGGYPKNAVLWYFPENEAPCLVYSLINDNTNNFVDDPTLIDGEHWKKLSLGGAGGEIGDMGFAPLGIDESLNLRRYLNGQVISQTQFVAFTSKVKSAVALFPNLGTTEANWQAEKLLSKFGQVGKFVIDDENNTIRLPAVVNPQGLLSLSGIGNLVNESLPNITGTHVGGYGTDRSRSGAFGGEWRTAAAATGGSEYSNSGTDSGWEVKFDASRSSSTYQTGAPVQQEAVQYPYYIQVATGVEETLPAIREYKVNNSDYFGKSMYSDVAPDNASWLASNGTYNARSVYPDYYDWLNGKIGQVITANGGKVVLSTDTYTDYDFVINTSDQTFRLPLLNGEEDLPGGRYTDLALTSTTQRFTAPANGIYTVSGIGFGWVDIANETAGTFGSCSQPRTSDGYGRYTVNAKQGDQIAVFCGAVPSSYLCRFIYAKGNGTLYYYVGDTVQDASLINAGAVLGQLSNKADIDASNFNADGKSLLSGLGMPSDRYIDLTLLASGQSYTAPANGWVVLAKTANSDKGWVDISTSSGTVKFNIATFSGFEIAFTIPVHKSESFVVNYDGMRVETNRFRFIYAEGEN